MKYIRTKDEIFDETEHRHTIKNGKVSIMGVFYEFKQADTIEELCDELVVKYKNEKKPRYIDMTELLKTCKNIGVAFRKHINWLFDNYKDQLEICNGAIWTDKGLIYKAKMNDKGELELL